MMRRLRPFLIASAAGFMALTGCVTSTGPVSLTQPAAADGTGDATTVWREVLREHTRREEVYAWTQRQMDLRATLVTPRLRRAFQGARSAFHGRIAADVSQDLIALGRRPDEGVDAPIEARPRAEEEVLVYVCVYVTDVSHRDLAARYSIWDVRLVRGAAEAAPLSVSQEVFTPALKQIFPHADRFDDIYVMRFPLVDADTGTAFLSPGGDPLELRVESALGRARVSWDLQ